MIKSSERNIGSELKIKNQPKKDQQLIIGDTKIFFYDSSDVSNTLKQKNVNRISTMKMINKNQINKPYSNLSRPQTTFLNRKDKFISKKLRSVLPSSKENQSKLIQLNFNQQNSKISGSIDLQMDELKREENLHKNRKNKTQLASSELHKKEVFTERLAATVIVNNQKKPFSSEAAQHNDKVSNAKQQENKIEVLSNRSEEKQLIQSRHINDRMKIRMLFGEHHQLFKIKQDYIDNQDSEFVSSLQQLTNQQKMLQQNISSLQQHINQKSQTTRNKDWNPSLFLGCNSHLFTNSCFAHTIERAPIVQYLKTCETKKLYTIMIYQLNSKSKQQQKQGTSSKYIDPEFNHLNLSQIDGQNVQWIYIQPNKNVKLFSASPFQQSTSMEQTNNKQLPFVLFLKFLYYFEPDLILKLFEPPVNNVYSVWLFVRGNFQPVFIDGFFPLDQKLNHFYGGTTQSLWLPILIKCFCKITNTYSYQQLQKISTKMVYTYLTGLQIHELASKTIAESSNEHLFKILKKNLNKGFTPLTFSQSPPKIEILSICQENQTILSYNPFTNKSSRVEAGCQQNQQIILIQYFSNWFFYSFYLNQESLNKFELSCQRNIELIFTIPLPQIQPKSKQRRIYVYECQNYSQKKSTNKIKLVLKNQLVFIREQRLKLKKGKYKIFLQDGQKKIQYLHSGKSMVKWDSNKLQESQMAVCIYSSHQIQLGQIQELKRQGNEICDSKNIYQQSHNNNNKPNFN